MTDPLSQLELALRCYCEPPWTDRGLHETTCKSEYLEDLQAVRQQIERLEEQLLAAMTQLDEEREKR
jgi:hypothetical protein